MKLAIIFFLILICNQSWGSANAIFHPAGDKVMILVNGPAGDKDATNLFNALNTSATESNSFLIKELDFRDSKNILSLQFKCKVSKTIANFGSCTVIIYKTAHTILNTSTKSVSYILFDRVEAALLAQIFNLPADTRKDIFESNDQNLKIPFYDPNGLGDLGISYTEFH